MSESSQLPLFDSYHGGPRAAHLDASKRRARSHRVPGRTAVRRRNWAVHVPGQLWVALSPSLAVAEFHKAFGGHVSPTPSLDFADDVIGLRFELIREEVEELKAALDARDLIGVADALGDITYVVYGAALTFGIRLDSVIDEIHRSNMTKLGPDQKPRYRRDGKVLKGPNYTPPDLGPVLSG